MTQSTVSFNDDFDGLPNTEIKDLVIQKSALVNYEYQVQNPTFNKKLQPVQPARNLRSSFDGKAVTGSKLGDRHTASPSDHVLEAVQSFWKKLRN